MGGGGGGGGDLVHYNSNLQPQPASSPQTRTKTKVNPATMALMQRPAKGNKPERTFSRLGLRGAALLGRKIAIFWEDTEEGDQWYEGEIKEYNVKTHEHLIFYDDGDRDWYVLDEVRYRLTDEEEEKLEDAIAQAELAEVSRGLKKSPRAEKHLAEAREATKASVDSEWGGGTGLGWVQNSGAGVWAGGSGLSRCVELRCVEVSPVTCVEESGIQYLDVLFLTPPPPPPPPTPNPQNSMGRPYQK